MKIRNDLTGQTFGKLTVKELAEPKIEKSGRKRTRWLCVCECGNEKVVNADSLKSKQTTSCGCIRNPDLVGKSFGMLTVVRSLGRVKKSIHNRMIYLCKCECGNEKIVIQSSLLSELETSCGCDKKENLVGETYHYLTVIEEAPKKKGYRNRCWLCKCICGEETTVPGNALKGGKTKSCGCKRFETKIDEAKHIGEKYNMLTILGRKEKTKYWYCECECGKKTTATLGQLQHDKKKSCGCLRDPNLTGLVVGSLTVLKKDKEQIALKSGIKLTAWVCKCECGNKRSFTVTDLKRGDVKSCGCLRKKEIEEIDREMLGQRFGRLVVIEKSTNQASNGSFYWICRCDCGNTKEVRRRNLIEGIAQSCGCLKSELTSNRMKQITGENHPNWNPEITHEERELKRQTPENKAWRMSVFIRDDFTCKVCGSKEEIEAHHIFNYSSHKKLRYKLSNGITLCEICHDNFHNMYTRKGNNDKQLLEYVKNIRGEEYAKTIEELLKKKEITVINPEAYIKPRYRVFSDQGKETFHVTKTDIKEVYGFKAETVIRLIKSKKPIIQKEVFLTQLETGETKTYKTYREVARVLDTSEHTIRRKAKNIIIDNVFKQYRIEEKVELFFVAQLEHETD
ncbi:HNH endonuclease [Priestia megaterium]|uniref:HNH endonuclease n=1 Tax=Priestia megaterium TaxID=1404 RepID=UPI001EEE43F1|nr:HNH endonuclease [Priestia megaterium]MCF8890638.1 HNH endonuclease [Priestia megaterium]